MNGWIPAITAWLRYLPRNCALCGQRVVGSDLCAGCRTDLQARQPAHRCPLCALAVVEPGTCAACIAQPPPWELAVTAVSWQAPADSLILECKRGRRFGRARLLADLLADAWPAVSLPLPVRVVPIPASSAALRRRGFNPAGEIARYLAARRGWQRHPQVLAWQDDEKSLTLRGSRARERRRRRRGALVARQSLAYPDVGAWVVVDDVMTTGSTLEAASLALRSAGARRVVVAAVARTPPPRRSGSL